VKWPLPPGVYPWLLNYFTFLLLVFHEFLESNMRFKLKVNSDVLSDIFKHECRDSTLHEIKSETFLLLSTAGCLPALLPQQNVSGLLRRHSPNKHPNLTQ
jgi:hypothetical protein